jgi:putative inorganic carbon (HCO3(-)) transporter
MGILLTTLYVVSSHLSPAVLAPELEPYRPLVWLTVVAVIAALVTVLRYSYPYRATQNSLLLGLFAVIVFSSAVQAGSGGLTFAVSSFLPSLAAYFLCAATVRNTRHLWILTASLILVALYTAVSGILAYRSGQPSMFVFMWPPLEEQVPGQFIERRIRGLGFLNDPNDFAQFLLVVMPFIWLAWRSRSTIRNLVIVIIPSLVILWGVLLTQSRGGILGFGVLLLFALRKRIGTTASLAATGILVIGIMASGVLRRGEISVHEDSAAGRVEAWGNGVAMWKSSPVWGVGYGRFGENNEDQGGLTAHNSYVLCFAELGTLGYLLWLGLIGSTLLDLGALLKTPALDNPLDANLLSWANAIRLALVAYLTTSWFLSRPYVMTLYVLLGMAVAVVSIANSERADDIRSTVRDIFWWASRAALASIVLVYSTLWMRLT